MSTTTTETSAQVNGETTYSSKFIPKVTGIPIVNSLKEQLFIHVPKAEAFTKHVEHHFNNIWSYASDTPIQPILIKLDTLAANGVSRLEKEVPIVTSPTDEILKKTKIDRLLGIITSYFVASVDFTLSVFNAYKGALDPILNKFEVSLGITPEKTESRKARVNRIRVVIIEKVDSQVTPVLNITKEKMKSVYSENIVPLTQYAMKQFEVQKGKAAETYSPIYCELISRYSKAELAAKDAWVKPKPGISGPNAVIHLLKSGIFVIATFGYNFLYPDQRKPLPNNIEDEANGLASGVGMDGDAKKRPNGLAS